MPRIRRGPEDRVRPHHSDLVASLADELRESSEAGQPTIDEFHFPETGSIRVTVIWDRWDGLPDGDRLAIILQAYEEAEGREFRTRIALATGLTVPEARESGLLPYEVVPMLRKGDPITPEQCREAMIAQGASTLAYPKTSELRFATEAEAERCVERLARQLPASEPVWSIVHDKGPVVEWA